MQDCIVLDMNIEYLSQLFVLGHPQPQLLVPPSRLFELLLQLLDRPPVRLLGGPQLLNLLPQPICLFTLTASTLLRQLPFEFLGFSPDRFPLYVQGLGFLFGPEYLSLDPVVEEFQFCVVLFGPVAPLRLLLHINNL